MSAQNGETFMSTVSGDILQEWLAVLVQDNITYLQNESSCDTDVIKFFFHLHVTI